MPLSLSLSLLWMATIVIHVANSQCTDNTITCTSVRGASGEKSVSCPSTDVLVSCGIFIDSSSDFPSQGTEMTDNKCNIIYNETDYNGSFPIVIARCCYFDNCYDANFECELNVERTRNGISKSCTNQHLLSCGVQQKFQHSDTTDTYQGIHFDTHSNTEQMKADYCTLFASNLDSDTKADYCPTQSPTASPTILPTSPTSPTSPTKSTTKSPTASPTTSPTVSTVTDGLYIYNQSTNGADKCTLEIFDENNIEYLWLYYFCCTEDKVQTSAPTASTTAPTTSPTFVPTAPTAEPTKWLFDDTASHTFVTPVFPLTNNVNPPSSQPTVYFDDTGNGIVEFIHWGVSNINRTYIPKTGPIETIIDKDADKYYFTIKNYKLRSGYEFTSEYGEIYLPDTNATENPICEDVPATNGENNIAQIHVYVDESTQVIEGMTIFRNKIDESSIPSGDELNVDNYTCHISMAEDNSRAFQNKLYENDAALYPNNTLDYSFCSQEPAGLVGFMGVADGFGIDSIQFEFVGRGGNCPTETVTDAPTTTTSLAPTPAPTPSPTRSPLPDTTASPTQSNANLEMRCYYVMAADSVSCETSTVNPSFMTACIAYSVTEQPNTWYIDENNECVVAARFGAAEANMAAIATCCYLKVPYVEPGACEKANDGATWSTQIGWTSNDALCSYGITDLYFGLVLGGVIFACGIWTGFIAFCVIQTRKSNAAKAKRKRLRAPPTIRKDRDGEDVAFFTEEQVEDRLALEKFEVDEEYHKEMVQQQRQLSSDNIGLQAD